MRVIDAVPLQCSRTRPECHQSLLEQAEIRGMQRASRERRLCTRRPVRGVLMHALAAAAVSHCRI